MDAISRQAAARRILDKATRRVNSYHTRCGAVGHLFCRRSGMKSGLLHE
jgi:hypothetical protein